MGFGNHPNSVRVDLNPDGGQSRLIKTAEDGFGDPEDRIISLIF